MVTWAEGAGPCGREMAREALRTLSQKQSWWLHPRQHVLSQPPSHQQRENNTDTAHVKLKTIKCLHLLERQTDIAVPKETKWKKIMY